jgi:SAM-dependent methyltransferase
MGTTSSRWQRDDVPRGSEYNRRFEALAAAGHDVHGEASFVMGYGPERVLDAGCGTGRVAIELARRGVEVVGIDLDRAMLETAVESAPDIEWFRADLSTLSLRSEDGSRRRFQLVVAAGNVMIFLEPGTEAATVARLAAHLVPGGLLVAGFQLSRQGYGVDRYDVDCANAGLDLEERFATWARDPWEGSGGYAVSVHRRRSATPGR